jgi:hypothetical protein
VDVASVWCRTMTPRGGQRVALAGRIVVGGMGLKDEPCPSPLRPGWLCLKGECC